MAGVVDTVKQAVKKILTPRDHVARQREALIAEQKHAAGVRLRAIDAAKQVEAEWERPRRERERLEQEHAARSAPDAAALGALERQLWDLYPVEVRTLTRWLARLHLVLALPLPVVEETHHLTEERTIVNLEDHERRARAIDAVVAAQVEIRDRLWKLPDAPMLARIAALRAAIEAEIPDVLLAEGELDVPAVLYGVLHQRAGHA